MKSKNFIITYLSALTIGILLLIYHQQQELYRTIVIVIGALVAVPSLVLLLTMLLRRRPAPGKGEAQARAVTIASELASAAGVALGVWMMCSPQFFITAIIYTLGAILLIVAIAQITYIYQAARPFRPAFGWFIVPLLTLAAGIVLIAMGPQRVASAAGLVTGIVLVVYAANGFASAGREARLQHDIDNMQREKFREEMDDLRREKTRKAEDMKRGDEAAAAGEPEHTPQN